MTSAPLGNEYDRFRDTKENPLARQFQVLDGEGLLHPIDKPEPPRPHRPPGQRFSRKTEEEATEAATNGSNGTGSPRKSSSDGEEHDHAAAAIHAEAEQLKARLAHRVEGQAITLQHLFPAKIAEALELRTRYLPANACAVAVLYLPSIASLQAIGSSINGNPASGFVVPLNLWAAVVGKTGKKKSPLFRRVVLEPTAEVRRSIDKTNAHELQQWKQDQQGRKREERTDQPQPRHLHVGDCTAEALTAQLVTLAQHGRGLLVQRDELAGLFSGLNQYKGGRGNDGQFLLELFDGGGHTSLRLGGNRQFSDSLVSITGCLQPPVLADLVNASGGDADGRYARFLFAPLTERPKRLPVGIDPSEQAAIDRAGQYLQQIADRIHKEPVARLALSPEAMELFSEYEYTQALAADAAEVPAQGAVLGKAAGKVLRVAGLLHRLDVACAVSSGAVVGAEPLMRAIDLVNHLNGWVLSLHTDLANGDQPNGLMRKLHDTAKATAARGPLRWKEFRNHLSKQQAAEWNAAAFEQAAKALQELGVGRVEQIQRGGIAYVPTGDLP